MIELDGEKSFQSEDNENINVSRELTDKPIRKYEPNEQRRMMKNVVVISVSFALLFTAYSSMSNLQSSINNGPDKAGLGNWSSSVVYATMCISALFVPTYAISRLTAKWAIFIFMLGYTTYIGAQFKPEFYTLIPAAAIVGFSAAPMWAAKCTYLSHIGNEYAAVTAEKNVEAVIVKFFGIFFFFFQTHAVFGNIISSTILSLGVDESTKVKNDLALCGANFCPGTNLTSLEDLDDRTKIKTLSGIYLGIAFFAVAFGSIFTDSLVRYGERDRDGMSSKLTGMSLLVATFKQMAKPNQLLIIPLTIWSGLEQGFISADFTAAYITCGWGVEKVGYVLICYGVADSLCSIGYHPIIKHIGRIYVFTFAILLNVALIFVFLYWRPNPDENYYFFIFAALWGVADAAWQCGINGYYGVLFPADEEASFSNYRLWEAIGFVISFAESNLMCVNAKLYILLGVAVVGMIGFYIIEYRTRIEAKRRKE